MRHFVAMARDCDAKMTSSLLGALAAAAGGRDGSAACWRPHAACSERSSATRAPAVYACDATPDTAYCCVSPASNVASFQIYAE